MACILSSHILSSHHLHSSLTSLSSLNPNPPENNMILGKRTRPPIKRTTSMTEFTLDISHAASMVPSCNNINNSQSPSPLADGNNIIDHNFLAATVSPRNHRRNSADCMETPHFMTVCCLCNRRLITGKDIFMYRGDSAFCSLECRQEKMKEDEKKDKHSLIPRNKFLLIQNIHQTLLK